MWSWLKKAGATVARAVKPMLNFVKQHKLISQGLRSTGDPRAMMAGDVAGVLGFGKKRRRRRVYRRRGGALKLAGQGRHMRGYGISPAGQ